MKTFSLLIASFLFCSFSIKMIQPESYPEGEKASAHLSDAYLDNMLNKQIDEIINDEMVKQNLPGIAIGVIENGKIKYVKGYGYIDIDKKRTVSTNTVFRWASISKPLTAVATLQLQEQSKKGNLGKDFSVKDKVRTHVDYWTSSKTNRHSKVTVEHLLNNNSGIQHYGDGVDKDDIYDYKSSVYKKDKDGYNAPKAVQVFKGAKLDFEPGSKYLYSTFGFNLLGAVVEEVSPDGYVSWIKNNIANKAGMTSLEVAKTNRTGYQRNCDGRLNTKTNGSQEWKLPGGGWESNIKDLTKFGMGIINGDFLDNTDALWQKKAKGSDSYYYGINKKGSGNSFRVFHGGAHDNVRTLMHLYPKKKYGVVIMCYAEWADCSRIAGHIYDSIFGLSWNFSHAAVDICNSDMKSCNGRLAGVWRKTGKDVIIRRGYSHKAFNTEWTYLRSQGYYCDDFEAYKENGKLRWDGIFRKGGGSNAMWRNFDYKGFKAKWDEEIKNGKRLVDLETYVVGGKRKWAGLFRPGSGGYAMYRNQSTDEFAKRREDQMKKGRKLIDIEVYEKGNKLYWSGVWASGKDVLLNRNYSFDEFNALWKKRRNAGYKLVDIEVYKSRGKTKWAGLWEKSTQLDALNRGYKHCEMMDKHEAYSAKGYELLDLERY
jgi:CubicO group peptidase (beta-lactamase class C family)